MSLVELKKAAKEHTPKIKQYYIKSRLELIKILTMTEFTHEMILEKKTLTELRKEAQDRNFRNIWNLRRSDLVELLYPSTKQNDQDDNNGKKHNNPQKSESDQIRIEVSKDV